MWRIEQRGPGAVGVAELSYESARQQYDDMPERGADVYSQQPTLEADRRPVRRFQLADPAD